MRVVSVVGARPQFVKAAVVSRALVEAGVHEQVLHTGQHYDRELSETFFVELGIPAPAHELNVGSASHGVQTARMLEGIEAVLGEERPDWVLVYGDTNSTLAGALAAAKLGIRIAHVEAGLRSFNRAMPEEINRVLTDHVADLLLVPTPTAVANLAREGISGRAVVEVGDVMLDAALAFAPAADRLVAGLASLQGGGPPPAIVTLHRAENTDDEVRLARIADALVALSRDVPVVLPLHPRTRKALESLGRLDDLSQRVNVVPPVSYLEMLALLRNAGLVVTDSGGVQKEAFFQRRPCVTVRDETEWVELVEAGWNRLAPPTSVDSIVAAARDALARDWSDVPAPELYGGGHAAARVAMSLRERVSD